MPIDSELEEILLRWDDRRSRGEPFVLEELCLDCPERLEEARRLIRMLEGLDGLIGTKEETTASDISAAGDYELSAEDEVSLDARCRVRRSHARGGLGEVYVAWDEGLRREVALKLIQHPHERDPIRRERFVREAEITATLGHPGIVPIFGLGQTRTGQPCYTMRYIEGETLRQAINRFHEADAADRESPERALAFRALLSRLVTVCQAIAFAHSRGVIHRDLKPENVMLGPFQETLVVDWGLAKQWREPTERPEGATDVLWSDGARAANVEDSSLTRMGATLGTPAYMSPEQASGHWDKVGPASDVYSLGATLYVVLTGQPAFQDSSRHALLDRVRRGEFPRPRQVKDSVPKALEAVCLRAMALRAHDRYAHVLDLASDLEHWLADEPVSAWREPALVRLGRWVRRHRPLVAGSAALALTALVALAVSYVLLGREQSRTKTALDESRAHYRMARTTTSDMQTSLGLAAAARQAPAEAALWFAEAAATADVDPDRALSNGIRARSWVRTSPQPVATFKLAETRWTNMVFPQLMELAFDGRGRYLLALTQSGTFVVHDIVEDRPLVLPGGAKLVSSAAWGGKNRELLALGDAEGKLHLVRIPECEIVETIKPKGCLLSLQFSSDGNLLALGCDSTRVWDIEKKTYVTPELVHNGRAVRLAFSPQADRLAVLSLDGRLSVFDTGTPRSAPLFEVVPTVTGNSGATGSIPYRVAFVNDGRGVVTLRQQPEFAVSYDATTGKELQRFRADTVLLKDALVSPNLSTLVGGMLGGVQFWDARAGRPPRGRFGSGGVELVAFTADESRVLVSTADHRTRAFSFPAGEPANWVLRHQDLAVRLAVSPNNAHFAVAQSDGLVSVWTLPRFLPREPKTLRVPTGLSLATSPDGHLVMPRGKYIDIGYNRTRVHDVVARTSGPELVVTGLLHGGAIAPDGREVVTLSAPESPRNASGTITFWDWKRGVPAREPIPTPSEPFAAAYSPDGRRLAVICARGECLWLDPTNGRIVTTHAPRNTYYVSGPANEFLRFSPDGKLLAQWGTVPPALFDATTGREHSPALQTPAEMTVCMVLDARFSPDSRYLAIASTNKTARIWDVTRGQDAVPPLTHPDWVFQVDFSKDGSLLLTGCRDGSARVWDWRAQKQVGLPLAHEGEVQDVRFQNGDRWVVTKSSHDDMTKSYQNAVQIWDWRSGQPLSPAVLVSSGWGSQLVVAPDESFAVLGSLTEGKLMTLDLANWVRGDDPAFPADRLREIAELASGQRIVDGSTIVSLTTAEWIERWRSFRAYPRDHPNPVSREVAAQTRHEAPTISAPIPPNEASALLARIRQNPDDPDPRYHLSIVLLASGDVDGYRCTSAAALEQFRTTRVIGCAHRVAHTCVLGPGAVDDPSAVVELARIAVPLFPGNERILGAALFRAGRAQQALEQFELASKSFGPCYWDFAFLALIHHALGHNELARENLENCARWVRSAEENAPDGSPPTPPEWYSNYLRREAHCLLDEARAAIDRP